MPADLGPWSPLSIEATAALMAGLGAPWWIAGGWAVDLSLGRVTRPHADMDVAVLRQDQPALARRLAGWDLHVAADGVLTPWRAGDWLEGGRRHQFWVRERPGAPWAFEILLEEGDRETWVCRRDPDVRLPLDRFGRTSPEGWPHVALEVALLYKASRPALDRNAADFEAAAPALSPAAKAWLVGALQTVHPGHPWIDRLKG